MFLESVRIFGFKSFAGKIDVKLGDGITGVLGPNGCGKSNIADAVRWVLGEQSVKQLRGASMEDVIFKGTRDRRPMGMAEVTLQIRNDDGRLPIEYTEVMVGRRLYRTGESEYLLNKTPCRLKDIRSILLDSGLGTQAYAVFERQMIDDILNDHSSRRREMFEEASGIMKYKLRRKEALRKLDHASNDLERVSDLMVEIEREVRTLSRQVGRARKYRKLKRETCDLDLAVSARILRDHGNRLRDLRLGFDEASGQDAELSAALRGGEAEVEKLRLRLLEISEALSTARVELSAQKESVAERRRRSEVLAERAEGLRRAVTQLGDEVEGNVRRAAGLETELSDFEAETERREAIVREREATLRREETELGEFENRVGEARARIGDLQQLTLTLREEASQKQHELARERVRHDEVERRRERVANDLLAVRERGVQLAKKLEGRRTEFAERSEGLAAIRDEVTRLDTERDEKRTRLREVVARHRELDADVASMSSRLETLEELRRSYEGYEKGFRDLLMSPPPGVHGSLAELLRVDESVSGAVEAALGRDMQAIVVDDANTAIECLSRLRAGERGRATFCPLAEMTATLPVRPDVPGVCLADRVEAVDGRAERLVEVLLGSTFVAADAAEARERSRAHPRVTWVTEGGDAFHNDRRISGGSASLGRKLLTREVEIERLTQARLRLETERTETDRESNRLKESLDADDTRRTGLMVRLEVAERDSGEIQQAVRHLEFELGLNAEEATGLDSEHTRLGAEAEQLAGTIREWEEAVNVAVVAGDARTGEWDQLNIDSAALESVREEKRALVGDLRVEYTRESTELQNAAARRDRLRNDRQALLEEAEGKRTRIADAERELEEIERERTVLVGGLEGSDETIASFSERVDTLYADELQHRNTWAERDDALRKVRAEADEVREVAHKLELEISSISGDTTRLRDRMFEEYAVVFLDETDADDLPLVVRHERVRRRRSPEELAAARAGAVDAQTNGAGEIAASNGHGEDVSAGSIGTVPTMGVAAAEQPIGGVDPNDGVDAVDGSEPSVLDLEFVEEVVVSDAMSVPHPEAHSKVSEDQWAPVLEGLRKQLANFGPVNEMAVEDYEERKERLDFLVTQRDDLVNARETLIATIRKVNKEARERFMATFEQAKKNFIEVHEVLFPGGKADLSLEGDDPLEGDIVMSARPQGKRVESIKLLSSGERALTAIALLFSIYMIKPSPFCILDEVDAPLDDANIDRFVRLVKRFADRTQFIMITHNKRTMEACNSLYGVTMEEPGISKLVSVKFHGGDVTVDGVARPDLVTT